jgi:5-methylcytosine-specific restriction endonuclease McrA
MHGVGIFEWNNRKKADYINKVKEKNKNVKKERIPYFSFKGESTHRKLLAVKKAIRLEAIANDTYFCKGCGRGDVALDCSHIIAVSQRLDLQLDKDNINLLCRSCHDIWGNGDIVKMLKLNSFKKDVEYILKHDNERFEKIMTKLQELENNA